MFMKTKYGVGVLTQKFTVAIKRFRQGRDGEKLTELPCNQFRNLISPLVVLGQQ